MSGEFHGRLILVWQLLLLGSVLCCAELRFTARFSGKEAKLPSILIYLAANRLTAFVFVRLQAPLCGSLVLAVLLFGIAVRLLRLPPANAGLACTVVFVLNTFFDGFLEVAIGPIAATVSLPGLAAGTAVQLLVSLLLLGILLAAYEIVARQYPLRTELAQSAYLLTLLPCVLIVWAVRLAMQTPAAVQLVWMLVSAIAFFSILAVNHRTVELINERQERRQLERECRVQLQNAREAARRWENTRAYQHDVRNHLLVVSGLLKRGLHRDASSYLQTLVESAERLDSEIFTGSAALDVLLAEKLRFARRGGISVTVDLQARFCDELDEADLCVIFANGLDNAIRACETAPKEKRHIGIAVKRRHDLLLVRMENGVAPHSPPAIWGTGLRNIHRTACKYGGSAQVEKQGELFCLTVLLSRPQGGREAGDVQPEQSTPGKDAGTREGLRP